MSGMIRRPAANTIVLLLLASLGGCGASAPSGRSAAAATAPTAGRVHDVAAYGAAGDGVVNDTAPIQRAVDAAAADGGGVVLLGGGRTYLAGAIVLRSRVTLRIDAGATLAASDDPRDYADPHHPGPATSDAEHPALLRADNAEHVRIEGAGTIDGRGTRWMAAELPHIYKPKPGRPAMLLLVGCRDAAITGITLRASPQWCVHLAGCERVEVSGVTIDNDMRIPNCDGIDIDHCRGVVVRDCTIRGGDDAVVLKTSRHYARYGPCEDVRVTGCRLTSASAALKIGSETVDDVRNVRFEDCTVTDTNRAMAIQLRDEGNVENVTFANIRGDTRRYHDDWWGRGEAINMTARPRTAGGKVGQVRGVTFRNIRVSCEQGVYLAGSPESRLEELVLEDVSLTIRRRTDFPAGEYDRRPGPPPDVARGPAAGIRAERVDGLTLRGVQIEWAKDLPDVYGPAMQLHDVTGLSTKRFNPTAAHPQRGPAVVRD